MTDMVEPRVSGRAYWAKWEEGESVMKRRAIALLAAMALVLATAVPALAAPKDAQGCENQKTERLSDYCG